jgi:pimeloyl-ACP methyl ester carboxylesterase
MWRNVINELEMDPQIRDRFQFWVFAYPTGNPPAYSALRLREELAKFEKIHPDALGYVLVGYSMGGIIARMQATTIARSSWDGVGNRKGANFLANVRQGSLVDRALVFEANPHVDRVVFICTPHHGSEMALGSLGEIGRRLISLPVDLTASVTASLGNSLTFFTGDPRRMPNSVIGLSPSNPMLKFLNSNRIKAPFHSIIGDRGKGDSPDSSDGVVGYWSSHLAGARSEQNVPGPHVSCELTETINELRIILLLHLRERRFLE